MSKNYIREHEVTCRWCNKTFYDYPCVDYICDGCKSRENIYAWGGDPIMDTKEMNLELVGDDEFYILEE